MTFAEVLAQVRELLQSKGRVSYRALKLQFSLDDDYLEGLKDELIEAERVAADEGGKVLVWVGASPVPGSTFQVPSSQSPTPSTQPLTPSPQTLDARQDAGERRQLTVLFCDLVGSTTLSAQLDPEEYREVVRAYHETCAGAISRYRGHTAQHLGDGILVYFGYPAAHEDDAARAVRTGLEIVEKIHTLTTPSPVSTGEGRGEGRLQIRIGIHTGLVVIGEIGSSEKREILAMGETPNIAARVQGQANPDEVMISAATYHLVEGLFECEDRGQPELKGVATPLTLYRVVKEGEAQSRFEVAVRGGLTPLVGREEELGLLRRRWEQAKTGAGQVVLLSGEPGIGKSRLVQTLKEYVSAEGAIRIEFRCSPYHQNSAFHPIVEHLQRLLQFERDDSPQAKLTKLQQAFAAYRFPQGDTLPLLATLLSLPQPEGTAPLALSPQKHKQKTQEALVAWIVEEAEKASVYCAWEDLHWIDPSSLEVLTLVLDQAPTTRLLALLTFRPEFTSPWGNRSHLSQMTLSRLGSSQVEVMVKQVTDGNTLPPEVVQQIVARTDGVPLFVEELTKMVIESEIDVGARRAVPLQSLGIPATLHDALMARLDRLGPAKEVAQMGAVLGREFSYELFLAVSPLDEALLQQGLRQLVEAELLYQRGVLPQATYLFKHALIQDTAYQSLLKSKRQQLHQQIAQVLAERFPETIETQPELLARHYTEAGLIAQALPYWQQAGENALRRSARQEAISLLTKGLELLKTLPDTPERTQQELTLQIALGSVLIATKGYGTQDVERAYTRAWELCQEVGEAPQLVAVLWGLWQVYMSRAELQRAHELGERLLTLAQRHQDPALFLGAHYALGFTLYHIGEFASARAHSEQGLALYDSQRHRSLAFLYGQDLGMSCLTSAAWALWHLGYPEQALQKSHEALALAQALSHPFSWVIALVIAAVVHQCRREEPAVQEHADAIIALCTEQEIPFFLAFGTTLRGCALADQGQREEGTGQIRQGLAASRATGVEVERSYWLVLLAEAHGKVGQPEEGLTALAEARALVDNTGIRYCEAELERLKGELTLQQWKVESQKLKVENQKAKSKTPNTQHPTPSTQTEAEAEACFQRAIAIAQKQQAKSLELRAVMSLSRLWQQQGKKAEAQPMLAEIYGWFTEGFDTKDLQEAKTLLEELS